VVYRARTFSKYFAEGAHGGTRKAFQKAVDWRDATEKVLGKPRTDRTIAAAGKRSRTGIQGVYQQNQSIVVAWTSKPGKLERKFISINKYGREEALRQAVEFRRKKEREVYGRAVSELSALRRRASGSASKARPTRRRPAPQQKTRRRPRRQAISSRSRTRKR